MKPSLHMVRMAIRLVLLGMLVVYALSSGLWQPGGDAPQQEGQQVQIRELPLRSLDPDLVDRQRDWTSPEGQPLVRGRYAYAADGEVVLVQPEGRLRTLALTEFAEMDRQWIERQQQGQTVLEGKVTHVADGDTIDLVDQQGRKHRVRLEWIDAPEKDQPWGDESRQRLERQVQGQHVVVAYRERDQYDRILGQIYHDGWWLNARLVGEGLAWHYRHYSDDAQLAQFQAAAQQQQAGLWSEPDPVPPWTYRQRQ